MASYDYDLFVLGSGPAGQRAAIQAAKLGKRAAIAEHRTVIGGVCINTGTIPSKTLRQAVMHLSGYRERSIYGASYAVKDKITMADLLFRADMVIKHEIDVTRHQLQRNGVEVGIREDPTSLSRIVMAAITPKKQWHNGDPYDRLILAATIANQAHLITKDGALRAAFPDHTIWD